jgi:GT2 family glycosyltransferase
MTNPLSIVLTTFNRAPQLALTLRSIREQPSGSQAEIVVVDDGVDDDHTPWVCQAFHVEQYIKLNRGASLSYRNAARPLNVGLRHATGDVVILQNAECLHAGTNVIDRLICRIRHDNAVFAHVVALDKDGNEGAVYCGHENQRPFFFCGAMRREWFTRLRGFDEDYVGYGYEDDDFADRLRREKVKFAFTNVLVHHQWHEPAGEIDMTENRAMYERKCCEPVVRNQQREWGAL